MLKILETNPKLSIVSDYRTRYLDPISNDTKPNIEPNSHPIMSGNDNVDWINGKNECRWGMEMRGIG
jgi:hypothetical protein